MPLSVPMLAKAICEYHQDEEVEKAFDDFVVKRFEMNEEGGVQVRFREGDKQILVKVTGVGSGMATLWECEFTLTLELVHKL